MSHNLTGIYFENQVIASKGLRAHARKVLSDGVIQGCELSFSGASVTIEAGFLMAAGGLMHNPAAQTLEVSGATSGYARVKAIIDLSKTATKTAFEQAWFEVDYSSTLEGFADPVQEDINAGGTVYELELCILSLGASGVTSIVQGEPEPSIVCGISITKIWENASPTSAFPAQTVTISNVQDYDKIIVIASYSSGSYNCGMMMADTAIGTKATVATSLSYFAWRDFTINSESIAFDVGAYRNGYAGTAYSDNNLSIPVEIYGVKGVQ